jgi:hypothetical protein
MEKGEGEGGQSDGEERRARGILWFERYPESPSCFFKYKGHLVRAKRDTISCWRGSR